RASGGICDLAEVCDGAADACPADAKSTAECRASAGICDLAEVCDGAADACPSDSKSTAECRSAGGVCDVAEDCDGIVNGCPADEFASSTLTCRESSTVCDQAETCTGAGADCPEDGFASSATVCRAAISICDAEENCTGASVVCPADAAASTATVCRNATGACDATETCDGAGSCPVDGFASSSTPCGSNTETECNHADTCDGAGTCQLNLEAPATPCGSSMDDSCTNPDTCDGSGSCQANNEINGTSCDDGASCNGSDTCASGACTVHAGDPCAGPDGDSNCSESCDEATDTCTAADLNGSTCNSGDGCTTGETCTAGVCGGGDSSGCTDLCGDAPASGCFVAGKFGFKVKDAGDPAKNQVKWKWKKGAPVDPANLGTPVSTTRYALCIYDRTGNIPTTVGSYDLPANAMWIPKTGAISYKDKSGTRDGFTQVKGKASLEAGKSSMQAKLATSNLTLPPALNGTNYFDVDPTLTVQLVNSLGACWTTDFTEPVKKNTAVQFSAVGP
ncbi:MAG TPA: hypothetical protein VN634_10760, partial [Candidatus Limnocylindrales bacterium]|nr:hypothetical protein [Candidatus Limnocylindrales bacterium]